MSGTARMKMNGFDVYREYLALKNHFTKESYDYFKYGGKVSARASTFETRRDRYYFEKLAKHRDPRSYILANVIERPNAWVGELVGDQGAEVTYTQWLKRTQSLTYTFKNELGALDDDFDANFRVEDGGHPYLMKLYLRKKICIETLIILALLTKCFNQWNKAMEYDPVWKEVGMRMIKYQPFINIDLDRMKKIVMEKFGE